MVSRTIKEWNKLMGVPEEELVQELNDLRRYILNCKNLYETGDKNYKQMVHLVSKPQWPKILNFLKYLSENEYYYYWFLCDIDIIKIKSIIEEADGLIFKQLESFVNYLAYSIIKARCCTEEGKRLSILIGMLGVSVSEN